MKILMLAVLAVVVLSLCGQEAFAVKRLYPLKPENMKDAGFAVTAVKDDDGMLDVTITRDLSKARSFDPASDMELDRFAVLEISAAGAGAGLIVRCHLAGEEVEGVVTYRFQLASAHLPHARLTVSEYDNYKKKKGERRRDMIGGGTNLKLSLADFIKS